MDTQDGILEKSAEIVSLYPICDQCLGRQFAWLSTNTTNSDRGRSIKLVLSMMADEEVKTGEIEFHDSLLPVLAKNGFFDPAVSLCEKQGMDIKIKNHCHFCTVRNESIFTQIPKIAARARKELEPFEFKTFLVGNVPDPTLSERQDEMRAKLNLLHAEALKSDFNRELGKHLESVLGKRVEFQNPDVVIIYDMQKDAFRLQVNPIFIYGHYRKLKRGIPQSRWDCSDCNGKGCEVCNETGRRYPDSVSEYIGIPIQEATKGSKFKFHAAGREDVDALMLGSGRPFVVEVSEPKIREIDLSRIESVINKGAEGRVEVENLEYSQRETLQNLKSEASSNVKEYTAKIATEKEVTEEAMKKAEDALHEIDIEQRTPQRVSHRRSDLVRKKTVYSVKLRKIGETELEGDFVVQGGTYIKELISGDDGRTTPSLSSILGTECRCLKLNVTAIHA